MTSLLEFTFSRLPRTAIKASYSTSQRISHWLFLRPITVVALLLIDGGLYEAIYITDFNRPIHLCSTCRARRCRGSRAHREVDGRTCEDCGYAASVGARAR